MNKIVCALFVLVVAVMLFAGFVFDKPHDIYPKSAIVTEVDYENDLVTITDFSGRMYAFYGCDDWYEGDICAAIMDDNGTPETVYDDIILEVRYCGWVE